MTLHNSFIKILLPFFALACLMASCSSNGEEIGSLRIIDIDPIFKPYVDEFILEAAKRGREIDFNDTGLKVEFSSVGLESASGFCYLGRYHIVIDKGNWFSFSEQFRSFLLFHELGHCELNRGHTNEFFPDRSWASIMRGDPFSGLENRMPVPYFGFRIQHYIDELFNPNTSAPYWATESFDYNEAYQRTLVFEEPKNSRINHRENQSLAKYEIETQIDLSSSENSRVRIEWSGQDFGYFIEIIPTWGYYLGVNIEGQDNYLFYDNNLTLHNGKPIEKITLRNDDESTQLFINEAFKYQVDKLIDLKSLKIESRENNVLNNNFVVDSTKIYHLD